MRAFIISGIIAVPTWGFVILALEEQQLSRGWSASVGAGVGTLLFVLFLCIREDLK